MLGDFLQYQRINPVPIPAPTSSRSNMPIGNSGQDSGGAGKMAKCPWYEKEALSY